jgi:hypothetical protein
MSKRPQVVSDALELLLHLLDRDRVAVGLRPEVQDHRRSVEPLERQLVDRLRRLAGDRRVVVVGRVDVCGVVRAEAHERLDRPALPVAQQLGADTEHLLDVLCAASVAGKLDLGPHKVGKLRRIGHDRRRQIDEPRLEDSRSQGPTTTTGTWRVAPHPAGQGRS